MNKVFCLGEAMSDTFLELEGLEICDSCHSVLDTESINKIDSRFRGNDKQKLICLPYGEKINVKTLAHKSGGSAFNVSVGLKRLGLESHLLASIGKDSEAMRLIKAMDHEGIDRSGVIESRDFETKSAIIIRGDDGDRTILVYHGRGVITKEMIDWDKIEDGSWFYLGPLPNTAKELIDYLLVKVEEKKLKLVVNPGSVQIEWSKKENLKVISKSELYILNKEEAKTILGRAKNDQELLRTLAKAGAKRLIITDGKNGSFGYDGFKFYQQEIVKVKTIDMTGAGDAYLSGVVAALNHQKDLKEAMHWGAENSAAVVEKLGGQTGLLGLDKF